MGFTMAGESTGAERPSARAGIVEGIQERQIGLGHRGRVQIVEMHRGQLRCIMALRAGESLLVHVQIVLPAIEAVVLRGAVGVAGRALGVHVDRAGEPVGRCLAAVAAHIGAGVRCRIERCGPGLGVVRRKERGVDRASPIVVVRGPGPAVVVARIADSSCIGQRIMRRMGPRPVGRGRAARRTAVAGRAIGHRQRRACRMAGRAGRADASGKVYAVAERAGVRQVPRGHVAAGRCRGQAAPLRGMGVVRVVAALRFAASRKIADGNVKARVASCSA